MDIKTYIAAAVVALTAACSPQETPAPEAVTEVNAADAVVTEVNPADRDHSEAREAHTPTSN